MSTPTPARKLTFDDYLAFPEDGQRHELLDGVEVVTPPPRLRHQAVVRNFVFLLERWCRAQDAGRVYSAPTGVRLSEHDGVEPDVLFLARERLHLRTEAAVEGAPDLVVEVLSPSTRRRDLVEKRERYGVAGVREYWVVDADAERVEVFRLEGSELVKAEELWASERDRLTSPLLPDFEEPVTEVFRE